MKQYILNIEQKKKALAELDYDDEVRQDYESVINDKWYITDDLTKDNFKNNGDYPFLLFCSLNEHNELIDAISDNLANEILH